MNSMCLSIFMPALPNRRIDPVPLLARLPMHQRKIKIARSNILFHPGSYLLLTITKQKQPYKGLRNIIKVMLMKTL